MSHHRSIQVYLCNGGGLLSAPVDFERLGRVAAALPDVSGVEEMAEACTELDGGLCACLSSGEAEGIVVVGCSEDKLLRHLQGLVDSVDTETKTPVVTADLKWSCRGHNGEGVASSRAEAILRQAVARAALSVTREVEPTTTEAGIIVFGEGHAALRTTAELSGAGFPVTLVTEEPMIGRGSFDGSRTTVERVLLDDLLYAALEDHSVEVLTETTLDSCSGGARDGIFEVTLRRRTGQVFKRRAGAVVVATEPVIEQRHGEYGLPEDDPRVMSQTELEDALAARERKALPPAETPLDELEGKQVAILVGIHEEASVVTTERALRLALTLVERGVDVSLATRNLKVAAEGVERLAQQCRSRGVTIHKIVHGSSPRFDPTDAGILFKFHSSALAEEVEIRLDAIIVDERLRPSPSLKRIVDEVHLETGPDGFIQPENVLIASVHTNHQAVLAVGPARGRFDVVSSLDDAAAAAMEARRLITHVSEPAVVKAEVDTAACAACLTCLRVCPHGAISFKDRPQVIAQFCEGCGQCAAECPMNAITMVSCSDERIEGEIEAAFTVERPVDSTPLFVTLACKRSAVEALRLAEEFDEQLPEGMMTVELPCAGRVDELHLIRALEAGADGVAVIGCHEGNCHSLHGNELAAERVARLRGRLKAIGLEPERLLFGTVAANTRVELAKLLRNFETTLSELGPSPLRRPTAKEAEAGDVTTRNE